MSETPMIIGMTTTSRRQQCYDHRLRDLVRRTGNLTIATDLGVPRSTARGWLGAAPKVVVSWEVADITEPELRQEIMKLRRRVEKLAALLRWRSPCYRPPGSRSQESGCRTEEPSCGSCAPWIGRASVSLQRSPVPASVAESVSGLARRPRVRLTISRPCPPDGTASTDAPGPRLGHTAPRVPSRPDQHVAVLAQRPNTVSRRLRRMPPRPGVAGDAPGFEYIRRNRRSGCARVALTRCGTSTPPSSACSTGHGRICTP